MMDINLNDNQLKAVQKTEGPLRIIAGPGSGKTRTIVSKIVHILNEGLAKPEEILAITFTNKATNEIKERVSKDAGSSIRNIFTYHGWCNYFLRMEYEALGMGRDFTIIDSSDSKTRISNLIKENDYQVDKNDAIEAFEKIAREEIELKSFEQSEHSFHVQISELWKKYSNLKRTNGQLDFNDLIIEVKKILSSNESIAEKWRNKYKYIFIDEFQDTNNVQFEIIRHITSSDSNITVVGDPDQNIYSWRGANIDLINNFNQWYPTAETIMLDTNYRSTPQIITASNNLISNNVNRVQEFSSAPSKNFGSNIQFIEEQSEINEAFAVGRRIESLWKVGNKLQDIAIIVRMSYKTRSIEAALNNLNIPYRVIGAMKFFDRAEVKQTLKFLLFAAKQTDMALLDIINEPPKKFGPKKIAMTKAAADEMKLSMWEYLKHTKDSQNDTIKIWIDDTERMINRIQGGEDADFVIKQYLEDIGYMNRLFDEPNRVENIKETLNIIRSSLNRRNSDKTINEMIIDFYNNSMLSSSSDKSIEDGEVNIITSHASKGTEFPFVFLYSFNEGHWPSKRAIENGEIEEERRVAYVAATRAMEQLIISTNEGIGGWDVSTPSRFIDEMISKTKPVKHSTGNKLRNDTHELDDEIIHNSFGRGTIIEIDGDFIKVKFEDGRVQELLIGHKSYSKI